MPFELGNCKDCIYFESETNECRCFTPVNIDGNTLVGVWPIVDPKSGWCGQFDDGEEVEFIKNSK